MNKIYEIERRLKEMTCLMTYWPLLKQKRLLAPPNSSINITGLTAQES